MPIYKNNLYLYNKLKCEKLLADTTLSYVLLLNYYVFIVDLCNPTEI